MATFRVVVRPADDTRSYYHDDDVTANTVALAKEVAAVNTARDLAKSDHVGVPIVTKVYDPQSPTLDVLEDASTEVTGKTSSLTLYQRTIPGFGDPPEWSELTAFTVAVEVGQDPERITNNDQRFFVAATRLEAGRTVSFSSDNDNITAELTFDGLREWDTSLMAGLTFAEDSIWLQEFDVWAAGEGETVPTFDAGTLTVTVAEEALPEDDLVDDRIYAESSDTAAFTGTVAAA